MFTEHDRLINGGIELQLGDITLKLRRLTDADLTDLDLWVRGQVLAISEQSIAADTPPERAAAMREAAMSKAMRTSFLTGDGRALMASPDGLTRIVWQASDGSVSIEDIRPHLFTPGNLQRVQETIAELNPKVPASVREGKQKAAPKPGQARRKRKKPKKN